VARGCSDAYGVLRFSLENFLINILFEPGRRFISLFENLKLIRFVEVYRFSPGGVLYGRVETKMVCTVHVVDWRFPTGLYWEKWVVIWNRFHV
jgi:hypothetical protein